MRAQMFQDTTFLVLVFFFSWHSIFATVVVSGKHYCLEDQKHLLIELKNNLTYFNASLSTKLVRWDDNVDCCQWRGVKCDSEGRVVSLDLSGESISGGIDDSTSSLFGLLHLRSLNLAYNNLSSGQLPSGFGKLAELSYLNLSNSGFSGQVPLDFSNLTRLVVLDLSYPDLFVYNENSLLKLENPDLGRLIHGFRRLKELYLDGVNISVKGNDWCNAISSSLPDLRVLSLSYAHLTGPFCSSLLKLQLLSVMRLDHNDLSSTMPEFFADFPNLRVLTLSRCNLFGVAPKRLFQIKSLQKVDFSDNVMLEGSLPEFPLNGSLEKLLLSHTQFSGILPESIGRLRMLSNIDLRFCNFSGPIPRSIKNLTQLVNLDLSFNMFNGSVPSFSSLRNLELIKLFGNRLTGRIPDILWEGLVNLNHLDLSDNSFEGEFPASLFHLPSLKTLDLSNNQLSGFVRGSTNNSSSSLQVLGLSGNNLEGPIPLFLFEIQTLSRLSLASNKFNGSVGLTRLKKVTNLVDVNLAFNNLTVHTSENVPMSSLFPKLSSLSLASCKMRKLPNLKNQTSLTALDLSGNEFRGEIPSWIWEVGNGSPIFLNLSHNEFTSLQKPFDWRSIQFLDLHLNMLSGRIPIPPPEALLIDLSNNNFSSSLPHDIGHFLQNAYSFSIANNKVRGTIPPSLCNSNCFEVLDLSNNHFRGRIPSCLFEKTRRVLNLGRNNLSGVVPDTFPVRCNLVSLDLSWNVLQGPVPTSLARCTRLQVLNLGHNELSDTFPCWLKNLSTLYVLVLRSNKFHGNISCLGDGYNWPRLQIIVLGSNNFSGVLPANLFHNLTAMMVKGDQIDHLHFESMVTNGNFYQDSVTVTLKGLDIKLEKLHPMYTLLDFSKNHFRGIIPETIGELKSLYVLNFSHNAISGHIPSAIGNLRALGWLDLSFNNLDGEIPEGLADLTSLSDLNVAHNHLVGRIPPGRQLMTFHDAFLGNEGLCGFPLDRACSVDVGNAPETHRSAYAGIYESIAFGFIVGVGIVFGPVLFSERWRRFLNTHMNKFVLFVLRRRHESVATELSWN